METASQLAIHMLPQNELLRYAQLAIKDLQYHRYWRDISPPLQMSLRLIHELRGDRGQGVLWKGIFRLEDAGSCLTALRSEAQDLRENAYTFPGGHHVWNSGGPIAMALGRAPAFKQLLERACGQELGDPVTHYNYYERESHRAYPHIDVPESHLNTVLMLQHDAIGPKQSQFVVYPYQEDPISFDLEPGELVLFWGGATVHERTPLVSGESIQVLSIGYSAERKNSP